MIASTACVTATQRTHGVFLDPPYPVDDRARVYGCDDTDGERDRVQAWCKEWQNKTRIVLAGYEGTYNLPDWQIFRWHTEGGLSRCFPGDQQGKKNRLRECLYISPLCNKIA